MSIISLWQIFRMIFVLFSIYLVGDILYRWDGFSYYNASFSEFLPTVALVTVYWSIIAACISISLWVSGRLLEWFFKFIGWRVNMEHWLLFVTLLTVFGAAILIAKQEFVSYGITVKQKLITLSSVSLFTLFVTWMCRNRAGKWIGFIEEKITPMVWLFGVLLVLSVPFVIYHML